MPKLKQPKFDVVGRIMAYEDGSLNYDEMLELFQHLVDNGQAWSLQGHYERMAAGLLERGLIQPKGGASK